MWRSTFSISLGRYLPIPVWAGDFIENLHAVGIVLAFACFAALFVIDIIEVYKRPPK